MVKKVKTEYILIDKMTKPLKAMNSKLVSIGKTMLKVPLKLVTAGFIALGTAMLKGAFDAAKFETEFAKVKTLLDETSFDIGLEEGTKILKEETLDLMKEFGLSVQDTNKALFDTISAGVPAGEAIDFLNKAAKLSIGGVTDLTTAVNGMTSIYNVYKDEIEDVSEVSNALFTAQKFGKTTVEELSNNVGKLAPVAKSAGISMEEMLAATSQLTLGGLSTEEATTALRGSISALISPTDEAKRKFEELGIPFGKSAFEGGKLADTLTILGQSTKGNIDEIAELIPNIRALTAVTSLSGKALENYDEIVKAIRTDTISLDKAFDIQMKTFNKQWDIFTSLVRDSTMEIGNTLLPGITSMFISINENFPKVVNGVRKFWIDVSTTTKIATETLKSIIAKPFRWETYKMIFSAYMDKIAEFSEAISNIIRDGLKGVADFRKKLIKEEESSEKTLAEKISEIKANSAEEKLQIEEDYQEKLKEIKEKELQAEEAKNKKVVASTAKTVKKQEDAMAKFNKELVKGGGQVVQEFAGLSSAATEAGMEDLEEMVFIQKGIMQGQILMKSYDAAMGAYSAMAAIPFIGPALGAAAAGAALAYGGALVSKSAGIKFAEGGIVQPTAGGTHAIIGEAGEAEVVSPLSKLPDLLREAGVGGSETMNVNVYLDGKQISRNVTKHQRADARRGTN